MVLLRLLWRTDHIQPVGYRDLPKFHSARIDVPYRDASTPD